MSAKGELPRPKVSITNVQGLFSGLIRMYDDLIGAKLTRKRTFARYLDAVNFKNGNPTADPNVQFPDDIWYQNYCQWKYRGGECGYTGGYFDINDKPCFEQEKDVCAKKLSSCKVRFKSVNEFNVVLPFGGFPGATRNNG